MEGSDMDLKLPPTNTPLVPETDRERLARRFYEILFGMPNCTEVDAAVMLSMEEVERAPSERTVFEVSTKFMTALFASKEDADAFIACLPPSVGGGLVPHARPLVKPDVLRRG